LEKVYGGARTEERAFVVQNGEEYVLVPVNEYERMILSDMVKVAVTQIEHGDDESELVDADQAALEFAARSIAEARKSRGLTQKQLGEKLGLPQSQISRIEKNPDRTTVRTLKRIAKALGADVGAFVRFIESSSATGRKPRRRQKTAGKKTAR
jgi:ribosome-binding protein aMBF1 (putative translation factor)